VENTLQHSERQSGERILGTDPKTGRQVSVKIGRFGPIAQIGTAEEEEKPVFAPLRKEQSIETISLEETLELFKLPRKIGEFEGKEMIVAVGRFGPYVRHDGSFYSLQKEDDPMSITAERGIELITLKREADKNKLIAVLGDKEEYKVLNGRYGPYFTFEKKNYKIPKSIDPQTLTAEQCKELVEKQGKTKTRTKRTKGK